MKKYRKTFLVTDEIVSSLKQAKDRWQANSILEVLEILIKYGMPEADKQYDDYVSYREELLQRVAELEDTQERIETKLANARARLEGIKFC